jgi:predicted nucleic acid-binding protein
MPDKVFVDTNVLVYSRDASEAQKQKRAMAWMSYLWQTRTGRLSFQVIEEYYAAVTGKLEPGLAPEIARQDVRSLLTWQPVHVEGRVIEGAWRLQDHFHLSWWDALIVSAAQIADCHYLLTEDLQEGQELGRVKTINPFRLSPEELQKA